MGLETAHSFALKGMYTARWCYCTQYNIDVGLVLGGCNSKIAVCLCVHTVV